MAKPTYIYIYLRQNWCTVREAMHISNVKPAISDSKYGQSRQVFVLATL